MKINIERTLSETSEAAIGSALVGNWCGIGGGPGCFFGLIAYPVCELTTHLLEPGYELAPNASCVEKLLYLIRAVVLPILSGPIAAWAILTLAGFPLSFSSCLLLTLGSIASVALMKLWDDFVTDCFRRSY